MKPAAARVIEEHPFAPVLPPQATVMMMGTFPPPPARRCMDFHYPNFNNDMWRIYGQVFFGDAAHFQVPGEKRFDAARIRAFLLEKGIALCPTVRRAIREKGNAADAFLTVVQAVDLPRTLAAVPHCHTLLTTGGKATEVLLGLLPPGPDGRALKAPPTGGHLAFELAGRRLQLHRLPSTSRAYPLPFAEKARIWAAFFHACGLLPRLKHSHTSF